MCNVIKVAKLQTMLDNGKFFHDLQKRVNQQTKRPDTGSEEALKKMKFECRNSLSLTWPDALEKTIKMQNFGYHMNGPISDEKLVSAGTL